MGQDRTDENHNSNELSKPLDYSAPRPSKVPTVVHVYRPSEVEDKRKDLPIVMMEQEIMEAINDCSSVIICGETGCGKTTQVPQVSFCLMPDYGDSILHFILLTYLLIIFFLIF